MPLSPEEADRARISFYTIPGIEDSEVEQLVAADLAGKDTVWSTVEQNTVSALGTLALRTGIQASRLAELLRDDVVGESRKSRRQLLRGHLPDLLVAAAVIAAVCGLIW